MLTFSGRALKRKPRWFVFLVAIPLFFSVQACVHSGGLQPASDGRSTRMMGNLILAP